MNKREEQLKNEIGEKYFGQFDHKDILGSVDFAVAVPIGKDELFRSKQYLLWAEAKAGTKNKIEDSFIQLIMTIGKEQTYAKYAPPVFLGAFDEEKMAFIYYHKIQEVFFRNDFDWTVAPSDHSSKEFLQLKEMVLRELDKTQTDVYLYYYGVADRGLEKFIKANFKVDKHSVTQRQITKNNFTFIYQEWLKVVRPTIAVNFDEVKKQGILDGYFFLADILSQDNVGLLDKLHVVLASDHYDLDKHIKIGGFLSADRAEFNDGMKAHHLFWSQYKRPPRKEFWEYFIERVDLLVPQDIRERKGSYFTPQIWVEKSQEYLEDVLGENWQEEYYIWDCCAGTGNMEVGLQHKYRVWASTLDKADVRIMHQRIENGANLLKEHCFQFDFLNDDLQDEKVPADLRAILADEEEQKKLIIYINPPYAEATNAKAIFGTGENKSKVSNETKIYQLYKPIIGKSAKELFAQFFIRVYKEIRGAWLAEFSTLKILQAPNFADFRAVFRAKLERCFIVPARTFDNVKGSFPIGFFIWNTTQNSNLNIIKADIINSNNEISGCKFIRCSRIGEKNIGQWISCVIDTNPDLGYITACGTDFQHSMYTVLTQTKSDTHYSFIPCNRQNLIKSCIYLSVRHCIEATWLNDRDQFLYPNDGWKNDKDFQSDCLAYTLFHGQNRISVAHGTNHWIPFTEEEVSAHALFASHFMSDFIAGKGNTTGERDLFGETPANNEPIHFTPEAQAVMDAGRELWRYYHSILGANPNASFYDIRKYFQGVDEKGKMNSDSSDQEYMRLIKDLREKQKVLAKQIEEKIYKYGFLYNGEPREDDDIVEVVAEEVVTPAVVKKTTPIKKKKEQTIIVQNIQVNGDLNVQTLIGSADIKK